MSGTKITSVIIGKILLLTVMVFALLIVAMIPILIIAASMNAGLSIEELIETSFMKNSLMLVQTICVIGAVILMYISFERKSGLSLGWKQNQPIRAAILGSNWGVALMSGLFLSIWALGGLRVIDVQFDGAVMGSLVFGLILFALVAINEELLCRGYIQGMLRRHTGPLLAITITSLLFSSLHLMNDSVLDSPIPLINLFLAGVLLGVSREVTGGLWVPIGIHFTWNYFQGYIYGFEVSGNIIEDSLITIEAQGNELLSGGSFGAEGSLLATVVLIVFIYVFWSRRKRELPIAELTSTEAV
jgi:membrane protease YdiL (CAAX protease family)